MKGIFKLYIFKLIILSLTMIFISLGWTYANAEINPKSTKYLLYCEKKNKFKNERGEQYDFILEFTKGSKHTLESKKINKDVYKVRTHYLRQKPFSLTFRNPVERKEGNLFYYKTSLAFIIYGDAGTWFLTFDYGKSEKIYLQRNTLQAIATQKNSRGFHDYVRIFKCDLYDKNQREEAINKLEKAADKVNKRRANKI
jgi:hypothetical protein